MKREAAEILKDALALPIEARAALAGSLLESLDTEVNEDAEAAWATEGNRRVAELDSALFGRLRRRLHRPWPQERAADSRSDRGEDRPDRKRDLETVVERGDR